MNPASAVAAVALLWVAVLCSAVAEAPAAPPAAASAQQDEQQQQQPTPGHFEYCVVGAGPGGLQVASMLREAGRDVVVLDKSARAGSFFARYPIHRRLISINKSHFAKFQTDPEFQLRHDWNSLISLHGGATPTGLKFSNYSSEYYPHADALVQYLGDFADKMLAGRISFGTQVSRIDKHKTPHGREQQHEGEAEEEEGSVFTIVTNKGEWTCTRVVVATGLSTPTPMPALLDHPVGRCRFTVPRVFAVDPKFAFRNFQRLKLRYDKLLSNFAFNCNLRHYHPDVVGYEQLPEVGWRQSTPG